MKPETCYTITNNPKKDFAKFDSCKDHTTGDGLYMVVNGSDTAGKIVWKETCHNLEELQTYEFKFWFNGIDTLYPSILRILINGNELNNSPVYVSKKTCDWSLFSYTFNSGNVDSAEIVIIDINFRLGGNDFGLDDISLKSDCDIKLDAGDTQNICKGESVVLGKNVSGNKPPFTFEWSPATGLSSTDVFQPTASPTSTTTYYLKVTDGVGCQFFDTTVVSVNPNPGTVITADKPNLVCPCDSILLSAPQGTSWLWTTGDISQNIYIKTSGTFTVETTNSFGCKSISSIQIALIPPDTKFYLDNINASIGQIINIPLRVETNISRTICGDFMFDGSLTYNSSMLTLLNKTINRTKTGNFETLNFSNFLSDSLKSIQFFVTLGTDSCTELKFDKVNLTCNNSNITTGNGTVCLNNLCKEPINRLFFDNGTTEFVTISPNPSNEILEAEISVGDNSNNEVYLLNVLGERMPGNSFLVNNPGSYKLNFSVSLLSPGVYFLILQSETTFLSKHIEIIR